MGVENAIEKLKIKKYWKFDLKGKNGGVYTYLTYKKMTNYECGPIITFLCGWLLSAAVSNKNLPLFVRGNSTHSVHYSTHNVQTMYTVETIYMVHDCTHTAQT